MLETRLKLALLDVRHKAERSHVDAADGHRILCISAADAEQRAVPAKTECKIRRLLFNVIYAAVLHAKLDRTHARQDDTHLTRSKERTNPQ